MSRFCSLDNLNQNLCIQAKENKSQVGVKCVRYVILCSGKTQKQLHELVRNSNFRRTTFVRASSRRSRKPDTFANSQASGHDLPLIAKAAVMENVSRVSRRLRSNSLNFDRRSRNGAYFVSEVGDARYVLDW